MKVVVLLFRCCLLCMLKLLRSLIVGVGEVVEVAGAYYTINIVYVCCTCVVCGVVCT